MGLAVEPDAKPILLDLYAKTLEALEAVPPSAEYRKTVEGMTKERLAVVEKTDDLGAIEAAIGCGQVEQLIEQAKDELSLIPMLVEADAFSPYDGPLSSEEILTDLKRRGWALQRDDIPMRPSQDFPIEKEIELEKEQTRKNAQKDTLFGAQPKRERRFFKDDGTPIQMNTAKWPFAIEEDALNVYVDIALPKFLDSAMVSSRLFRRVAVAAARRCCTPLLHAAAAKLRCCQTPLRACACGREDDGNANAPAAERTDGGKSSLRQDRAAVRSVQRERAPTACCDEASASLTQGI